MVLDSRFGPLLQRFAMEELEQSQASIYGLWPDFSLAYLSDGWFRFARENQGEPQISRDWGLGRSLLDAIPAELLSFYAEAYRGCLNAKDPWQHEYECSSPETFRLLHQTVYPLERGEGLLVVNSIAWTEPIPEQGEPPSPVPYRDAHGVIVQCCHCRKFKNHREARRWDWISPWVAKPPREISHGICEICLDFYYPRPGEGPKAH